MFLRIGRVEMDIGTNMRDKPYYGISFPPCSILIEFSRWAVTISHIKGDSSCGSRARSTTSTPSSRTFL